MSILAEQRGDMRMVRRTWPTTVWAVAALALAGAGHVASAQEGSATVTGVVFDSTEMKPLAGARVAVLGTSALVEADESGRFELEDVPAGSWWVSFFHPRLQALGVSAPSVRLELSERERARLELSIPSETTLLMGWCMAEQPGPGFAALAGVVVDSLTGVPMPSAQVRAQVADRGNAEPVVARTDDSGYYRMCAVPAGRDIRVQASFGMSNGRTETVRMPERGAVIKDLNLLMSAEGTLVGRVLDYQTGQPVSGAEINVVGSESKVLTDADGKFILDDLPPGRHLVVTEGLGYETRTDSVTVFSQETVDVELRMATEALEMEGLVVTARTRFGRTVASLAQGAKRGDFITRADIEPLLNRATSAGDVLRFMNVPGLSIRDIRVVDIGGAVVPGLCVEVSRRFGGEGCAQAALYLNDVHMPYPDQVLQELDPNIIERIEILSPIDAQFQFGTVAGNGAVAIYTR